MLRLAPWVLLVAALAVPNDAELGPSSQLQAYQLHKAGSCAQVKLAAAGPVELADLGDDGADANGAANVSAALASLLRPATPKCAVAMPSGAHAAALWSRAIQECGPPCA